MVIYIPLFRYFTENKAVLIQKNGTNEGLNKKIREGNYAL
jgi:hypothetical protein